jgi:hypothetical protein
MYEVLVKALPAALKTNVTRHLGKNFKLISTEFSRKGQRRASLHYLLKSLTVLPLKDLLGFSGGV